MRPQAPVGPPVTPGVQALGLTDTREPSEHDGLLYVPADYDPRRPAPLAVLFHGAGGRAAHGLGLLQELADGLGLVLVAPASRGTTWDVIERGYGPDVAAVDRALAHVFARVAVDPVRLGVGGFSDGASYALSLGLTNGDLFTHVLAFAPGFMAPAAQRGAPRVFVTHGTHDGVLPIDRCSRRIVPVLREADYSVMYREFEGGHAVPPDLAAEAARWFVGDTAER